MNQLIDMSASMTMGTREIADLLGKNHSDIKRSADRLFDAGAIGDGQPLASPRRARGWLCNGWRAIGGYPPVWSQE